MNQEAELFEWLLEYEVHSCERYRRFLSLIVADLGNNASDYFPVLEEAVRSSDVAFAKVNGYVAVVMGETPVTGALQAIDRYMTKCNESRLPLHL